MRSDVVSVWIVRFSESGISGLVTAFLAHSVFSPSRFTIHLRPSTSTLLHKRTAPYFARLNSRCLFRRWCMDRDLSGSGSVMGLSMWSTVVWLRLWAVQPYPLHFSCRRSNLGRPSSVIRLRTRTPIFASVFSLSKCRALSLAPITAFHRPIWVSARLHLL